ncbi:BZ3500_MvSof-1268-A1-R1_Chr7-3g09592 [Microbotryum saponariae]|uniref:EKC/KEOPS complex subunit CGI121 n=1 Tax=Microbotryum saponariae TaxID=289078 RepID=A0A2X0L6G5_9BASI|nr:BZ3501_MvSof-1269-A2-R1_Chr7-2g09315 [Microbotryum saponariae]SDA02254.1 BZ3500_MvSof-1268-A1-R1_Chr7-3g09592 [Microbotryum saponariae]
METILLSHHNAVVHYALFSLRNASYLRQRLVAASTLPDDEHGTSERQAVDFAFVDASMVSAPTCSQMKLHTELMPRRSPLQLTSRLHLLTAVSQALLSRSNGTARTHTIHSEILYALEPGTNISDSLKHFGLSNTTQHLCLVHVTSVPSESLRPINEAGERVLERMQALADGGDLLSLDQLGGHHEGSFVNEKSLRKLYKLNQDPLLLKAHASNKPRASSKALDELVTSAVALKVVT